MSTRASIFGKVLPYVDKDDWADYGDYMVFGREAFEALAARRSTEEEQRDQELSEAAVYTAKPNRPAKSLACFAFCPRAM